MSKHLKTAILDSFDQVEEARLEVSTLITALVSCEAFNGAAGIDRVAYLEMVVKKQNELHQRIRVLRDTVQGTWS